ncbi:lysozyme [Oxalobacteraceae bacterium GrIS 1.11]
MANENMIISVAGIDALRMRESGKRRYYHDPVNNVIYGLGTLAHLGPCLPLDKRAQAAGRDPDVKLGTALREAEALVRRHVRDHTLTQQQFDALVSYAYDRGPGGARRALDAANRGACGEVACAMNEAIYIHLNGGKPIRSLGLVYRRSTEAAPFASAP